MYKHGTTTLSAEIFFMRLILSLLFYQEMLFIYSYFILRDSHLKMCPCFNNPKLIKIGYVGFLFFFSYFSLRRIKKNKGQKSKGMIADGFDNANYILPRRR